MGDDYSAVGRGTATDDAVIAAADGNPLDMSSGPDTAWTTANSGEVMPGVLYPLGWSFWGDGANAVIQRTFQSWDCYRPARPPGLTPR